MKRPICIVLLLMFVGACLGPRSGGRTDAVQLVYHSDTRGYYLPCG